MSMPTKTIATPGHQILLYDRVLHPELFPIKGRRLWKHGSWEIEPWVMPGAHLVRFDHRGFHAAELVCDPCGRALEPGAVAGFPAMGERDFEFRFERRGVTYMTSVHSENLSDIAYDDTYRELSDLGRDSKALMHRWDDAIGQCLSMVDIQRYPREAHVQAYHAIATAGLVIRTTTIFEHA